MLYILHDPEKCILQQQQQQTLEIVRRSVEIARIVFHTHTRDAESVKMKH